MVPPGAQIGRAVYKSVKRREARFKYILSRRHTMNEKMLKELLGGGKDS